MVEAFCATWKLADSHNFDEYMKALGRCEREIRSREFAPQLKYKINRNAPSPVGIGSGEDESSGPGETGRLCGELGAGDDTPDLRRAWDEGSCAADKEMSVVPRHHPGGPFPVMLLGLRAGRSGAAPKRNGKAVSYCGIPKL
ncbi:hypothetical protein ASZ78_003207 [Callipepla squamata]|uniref:Cytosolic fatty-acid binding proteins domain-containing protein n=1 Tax=Callipepla squamata TaxID=9009 RepID=A0A226ML11_CALSU|nr:hypothetical protein ASZ78_003207 [Callipepla squamata]